VSPQEPRSLLRPSWLWRSFAARCAGKDLVRLFKTAHFLTNNDKNSIKTVWYQVWCLVIFHRPSEKGIISFFHGNESIIMEKLQNSSMRFFNGLVNRYARNKAGRTTKNVKSHCI
jgi:hypothetical protein